MRLREFRVERQRLRWDVLDAFALAAQPLKAVVVMSGKEKIFIAGVTFASTVGS